MEKLQCCYGYLECRCRELREEAELVVSEVELLQSQHPRQAGRDVSQLVLAAVQDLNTCQTEDGLAQSGEITHTAPNGIGCVQSPAWKNAVASSM